MSKKIALVTGANKGIGFETCRQLGQQGIEVILTSRNEGKGRQAQEVLQQEGLNIHYHPLQVTNLESVFQLKDYVVNTFGRLDILINNAGVYLDENENIIDIEPDIFRSTLHINLFGPFYLCRTFLPLMKQKGYGRIVNVSSGYGALRSLDSPNVGSYKLSKVALNGLTRLMSSAVDNNRVKVNSADPGWVHTDMGGPSAPRSPQQAAEGIVWLATLPDNGPSGKFFYDKKVVDW